VCQQVKTDPTEGLEASEAQRRLETYGPNRLATSSTKSPWDILVDQFMSLIIGLLVAAGIVAFLFGEYVEMIAIGVVVIINTGIGFFTELRAIRSMEALKEIAEVTSQVIRDGTLQEIPARQLVPGDLVRVEAGNLVGADMRLVQSSEVEADESVLTGESMPVSKGVEPLDEDTGLADRTNMVFRGTAVTRGHGRAVVTHTGMQTEVGRITELVDTASKRETPLEERLDDLGKNLVWVCVALAAAIGTLGYVQGKELFTVVETAIALAVATIPEGLPIVATLALARGMWRMADRNALVRNLAVVETLGSASLILTDKTGTLTKNQMTVARYATNDETTTLEWKEASASLIGTDAPVDLQEHATLERALRIGVLCNNEPWEVDEPDEEDERNNRIGEPMEMALLEAAGGAGCDPAQVRRDWPRIGEEPFDASTKMMATFHRAHGEADDVYVAVKGAPEAVLNACSTVRTSQGDIVPLEEATRDGWNAKNLEWGKDGLRVLALAEKQTSSPEDEPYEDLTLIGLVGMIDPPRADVKGALEACRDAGIRVVMVTGDQPGTALHVAQTLGMVDEGAKPAHGTDVGDVDDASKNDAEALRETDVFSRVTPEQKFDLVQLHQEAGEVVAMTGDGVNDAPALMQADIGVAMGKRGTQVAREAADMVLGDDSFSTIVAAVRQGRVIFENIRKFVVYLLSCNVSELLVISIASVLFADLPLPLTALQILFLNLVTDVFPALALGFGEGSPNILEHPPRDRSESILTRRHWGIIAGWGAVLTIAVLTAYGLAQFQLGMGSDQAVTVSFLTLAFAQLWHVFNMRSSKAGRLINDVTKNPFVWGALGICTALTLIAVFVPPVAHALDVVPPSPEGWLLALGASLAPALLGLIRP
jgi:Ca2+-transporting ATPase